MRTGVWLLLFTSLSSVLGVGSPTLPPVDLDGSQEGAPVIPQDPADAGVLVDPALQAAVQTGPQLAVLVLQEDHRGDVLGTLERLAIDHHPYRNFPMVGLLVDVSTLPILSRLPGVVSIHSNEQAHVLLDQSTEYVAAATVWKAYETTGRGVTVFVVDSGIDGTHPDVEFGKTLIDNVVPTRRPNGLVDGSRAGVVASDDDGHGTHVAGIVAGAGQATTESQKLRGVAWGARLVGYQAGLPSPEGETSFDSLTVLEAYDWALAHREELRIRIVVNSWGANGDFDPRSPINLATLNLYRAGLLVVFAAGNEGEDGAHSLNKFSVAPWVLSVGVGDYLNRVPSFSSRGTDPAQSGEAYDHPDIVAPGVGIRSARPVQGHPESHDYYQTKSGSSMAAPHVAGAAALLLEAHPALSPDDLMDILTAAATPLPRHETWEGGAGFLNVLQAYQLAARSKGHQESFLDGHVKYAGPASGDPEYARDAVTVGYLHGTTHRLRGADVTLVELLQILVATPWGWSFLTGTAVSIVLAVGWRGDPQRASTPAPTPRMPLRVPAALVRRA